MDRRKLQDPAGREEEEAVRVVSERSLYEGFGSYREMVVDQPLASGGTVEISREFQARRDVVAVLPYDPVRRVALLARQLRVPLFARGDHDGYLEEVPAGYIDEGESAVEAARREAAEEVGVKVGELVHVADVFPSPGSLTERLSLYLARYGAGDVVSGGGGLAEEGEEIEVLEWPLARLGEAVQEGGLSDAKTLILVQALMLRAPDLFS
ncbi:NUDIX domain-containing protein [Stappia sp. TSB10GB4]|uniref:NUDIX domain-containing protein n=1 Tax=Stappia sp. TSB10GB4 TaxID=2003584 RepID=UPI0016460427|nr:NUDIX domain-containing protein [Stappia sp. TSB10GB4]